MYSESDLQKVEQAIFEFRSGKCAVNVWYGDTSVQYSEVNLKELFELRKIIKSQQKSHATRNRQIIFSTSKGV